MTKLLADLWPHITAAGSILLSVIASAHAILYKRDTRSAVGWVGLIWLVPVLGAIFYVLFGINRIRRRASAIRGERLGVVPPALPTPEPERMYLDTFGSDAPHLLPLVQLAGRTVGRPLLPGNRVMPLVDGDAAYPAMIKAIDAAERSVTLGTYIFDSDEAGRPFADALIRAWRRGVQVRVLVDAVGARYSWPSILRILKREGVPAERFLPTAFPWRMAYMNLRNHRKVMVVDGRVGFTGGMNIREGHLIGRNPKHPVRDVHFRLEGPIVSELQATFADDWAFTTREELRGELWFPTQDRPGHVLARGIRDGPDEDFEKLAWTILGALACARSSVRIMTPYFLPDAALITALNVTALRGVKVEIILPSVNNLLLVKWASMALLWQVLEKGCRVYLSPAPFDHTKLFLVDRLWAMIGSANLDPRSLRLNFEFCLECYDRALAFELDRLIEDRRRRAREITLADVDGRSLPVKLRDGAARLFSPYL